MFVRFKRKETQAGEVFNLSIQESFRDLSRLGQVRSRTIAGLGSIPANPHPTEASLFWFRLDEKLRTVALSTTDEEKVRASIQQRIPRPATPLPQLVRHR
jgi:hypothetical protein